MLSVAELEQLGTSPKITPHSTNDDRYVFLENELKYFPVFHMSPDKIKAYWEQLGNNVIVFFVFLVKED